MINTDTSINQDIRLTLNTNLAGSTFVVKRSGIVSAKFNNRQTNWKIFVAEGGYVHYSYNKISMYIKDDKIFLDKKYSFISTTSSYAQYALLNEHFANSDVNLVYKHTDTKAIKALLAEGIANGTVNYANLN